MDIELIVISSDREKYVFIFTKWTINELLDIIDRWAEDPELSFNEDDRQVVRHRVKTILEE